MVVGEASIHNIMGGMESTGGVRLHNHKRKLKQRFDIIKKLGQGTYGKVQLGINKETGQEVAIKTIKKCKIETEADLIRIRREIQIMSSVQHPNIIHIYEVFENREKMVLVMEYAAGGELYDYLSERKVLSELEARRIFRQISTAVFYCHKHKICHRDLKLENILLDQVGNAKIADFGLSNVFDEQRLLSTFCGSPLYASPEIVKGTPYHGPEVDCWSLGVLLYTLVYGAMPFDGSNFKRLVKQISQSDYFEPKKPSPASPLIKEMLTVCPARRADIEKICTHWWVNEGYEQNCLDIAEDLAAQTPVRLDLLLSLVPQSASAEKLLVGDQQGAGDVANNMSSETLVPTRCHSVGSLMELDQNNSDRRIREMLDEEPRSAASGDAKRKLETTPSMDETAAAGVKRKERSRRKERSDEREPRTYRSGSRHHSAPIPNSITEEAMEVDPTLTVPTSKTVDIKQLEGAAACLELIEECKEKSPSKERSKTPVPIEEKQPPELPTDATAESRQARDDKVESGAAKEVENKANVESTEPASTSVEAESEVPSKEEEIRAERDRSLSHDLKKTDSIKELKKLKEKALSLDSELSNEPAEPPSKPVERRRSKIFETAEKFNQLASGTEPDKPKKIFIPGVNVGGAKRVFERKASLSSIGTPPTVKPNASKVIIDVPPDKKSEKEEKKDDADMSKRDEAKKRAVDIITGAIGKPPVQRKVNGSPPTSPPSQDPKKLGLKIQVAPNDVRTATVSVSTPVDTKFPFDGKSTGLEASLSSAPEINLAEEHREEPKMSSKMEITLKSATLPRPRKTSKAEITLSGVKPSEPVAFKSEVEAKIDAFHPQKLRTQRSEVAFPVAAAVPQANRSSSLEPEVRPRAAPKERIIPIQVEAGHQHAAHASTPPPKPPMPQRSMSQRSSSLSRQSTADSDTDSALGSTVGPEPIRKSPREYIIPIAVEGGGYVTPRSGSVEPESKTSTPTSTNPPRSRFIRPRRMSSLLSDASEDESPFSTLHRDSEDLLQRHMHRLRSSRPSRQPSEHADSLSSGEDDDDDGFELLTAENLFSTLLSRVRSLTQRLNVDDNRGSGFPSSRLLSRFGSNSPQTFWGLNKPLSRRLSESQFKHSLGRDADLFSRKNSVSSSNPGTPNSPGTHATPSRESVFEVGSSNTLPRDKVEHEDDDIAEAEVTSQIRKEAQETLEQSFTPSLARRLSRQFIEQTRQNSLPRERYGRSPTRESLSLIEASCADDQERKRHSDSTASDRSEYRSRSMDRGIRRTNSLLETTTTSKAERREHRSPRRSISLFDDDDRLLPPLPRQVMTLGRKYKEGRSSSVSRRENYHAYRADKIQEEPNDDSLYSYREADNTDNVDNGSTSECTSISICNSNTNIGDTVSSVSARSCETSSTESTSNVDYGRSQNSKTEGRNFESRLLAAENLIKESKLRNLGPGKFNPNLTSSYKDTDKCDKETLGSISDPSTIMAKRRSCIPSLRLRSGSLTRESSTAADRRKSFSCSHDGLGMRAPTPERSILSKLFRSSSKDGESKEKDKEKDKTPKPRQHRISRFLRPDFFDTPREESQYVKEKEAQKAAENERRKSRFMRKKNEAKAQAEGDGKAEKELKNEMNSLKKDKSDVSSDDKSKKESCENPKLKFDRQNSRSSFLHSLEKKLEKFRSGEEVSKVTVSNGSIPNDVKNRNLRENSAPPAESSSNELGPIKKALSVEDLAPNKSGTTKSRVSSVLSLFKNNDKNNEKNESKQSTNGARTQVILSKLKKSPPKMTKPESIEETPSTSKIPMKSVKSDPKLKKVEAKRSPEKILPESKRSPPKERPKELLLREKKSSPDKMLKESRKSNDKLIQPESSTSTADSSTGKDRVKVEPIKTDAAKNVGEESEQKVIDNKQEVKGEEKKLTKTKKNISTLGKSASSAKSEDTVKKVVKTIKKEEGTDGLKKKKIVRVVKKVVKKSSDSSESKSEEKEKSSKPLTKRILSTKKETNSETPASSTVSKMKENNNAEDTRTVPAAEVSTPSVENSKPVLENLPESDSKKVNSKISEKATAIENVQTDPSMNGTQARITDQRASRAGLKLDLSKIPQHTFRNTTPKKESPKLEEGSKSNAKSPSTSPKSTEPTGSNSGKLLDNLSKMSYHANITGNKIIIDKPLRAKDVAELKKEVTECARIIESHIEAQHELHAQQAKEDSNKIHSQRREDFNQINSQTKAETSNKINSQPITEDANKLEENNIEQASKEKSKECAEVKEPYKELYKEQPLDTTSELFSPTDEPESFDSWSICSADMNHTRGDLNSPTSPSSYPFYARGDQAESVIDRIRRRSFYSRFNDRKRASLTAPPPGVTLPSTSLSRKYSFNSPRERKSSYGSSGRRHEKYYDDLFRRSPVSRERYDASASPDLKSPADHYGSVSTSNYDTLRRYLRSPTLDVPTSRRRYHSTDFGSDELGSYRSPLSGSLLNDSPLQSYAGRSTLPRHYGSTVGSSEPKSVEYYEELLAPTTDYLSVRRASSVANDHPGRCENGYSNGNVDLQYGNEKRSPYADKTRDELTEDSEEEIGDKLRSTSERTNEAKDLPISPEPWSKTCTAE